MRLFLLEESFIFNDSNAVAYLLLQLMLINNLVSSFVHRIQSLEKSEFSSANFTSSCVEMPESLR